MARGPRPTPAGTDDVSRTPIAALGTRVDALAGLLTRAVARRAAECPSVGGSRALQRVTLYRGMQASTPNATTPLIGDDAGFKLGVRDNEFATDAHGNVVPGSGGMSTANLRNQVPGFTASSSYAFGAHPTTNQGGQAFRWVWSIDDATLPAGLQTRNDHHNHVHIEAANSMTPGALRTRLHGTQAGWTRSAPP